MSTTGDFMKRVYRKKHFYKVTWSRSEELLKSTPWLKNETHDFCMIGYSQPTAAEAREFIGDVMFNRLFDQVSCVQEISKEEALRDFQMDNWKSQVVFDPNKLYKTKPSLDSLIQAASTHTEESSFHDNDHVKKSSLSR